MSVRKALTGLVLVFILVGLGAFFNQPKSRPFPFSRPLEFLPDYQAPGEGVTLYPTGGPFGFDIIEAIAMGDENELYVGTFGGGLFKSEDRGKNWRPMNRGLKGKFISTLFVLEDGKVFAGTIRAGLFMSKDHGKQWISVNKGLERTDVKTIIMLRSGVLLAGTGKGVYISRNEGQRWEPYNKGLDHTQIQSIVATRDQTLFAGTQGIGIFKRGPQDDHWFSIASGFSFKGLEERVVRTLVLGREEVLYAGTMSAGIFRSADGGTSWQNSNAGLNNLSIRTLTVDNKGILYAGTGEGVYYSENNGGDWIILSAGMENDQVHSFVANKTGALYAGSSSGLYVGDIHSPWRSLHDQLLISPILSLTYGDQRIVAGTAGKGTYVNRDDNWMSDNLGLVNLTIRAMARGKVFLYVLTNDGVYRRQLGRHQWKQLKNAPDDPILSVTVDAADQVYLGTSAGLFSSGDHGESWTLISALGSAPLSALAVSEQSVFAATKNTIWSKSPKTSWKKVITQEGSGFKQMLWRTKKGLIAITPQQILEQDLQGLWSELKTDGLNGLEIQSIAVDPHNSDILYVGTNQGLIWSADNGASWEKARLYHGEKFEDTVHQVLATDNSAIWLATEKEGVVIGISKPARRNVLQQLTDRITSLFSQ